MSRLEELLRTLSPDGVEYRRMWEVTTWDKRFNGVENYKQPSVVKYHYFLANELKSLATETGNVKLLFTSTSEQGVTTEEVAGEYLSEGEIVAIPWGGNPQVQYYKGKFITSDNRIATSNNTRKLSNKFLYYWIQSKMPLIDSFYRGSGIKHPSMAKVLDLKVPIPPLPVQEEIVRILDTFSGAVAELEQKLNAEQAARVRQYEYYRNELLSFDSKSKTMEKLFVNSCVKKVELLSINEVLTTITPPKKLTRDQYKEIGTIPIIDQGQNPIVGYTDDLDASLPKNSYVLFGDHTRIIKFVDYPFAQGADGLKILIPRNDKYLTKYLYYALQNADIASHGYSRHWSYAKKVCIPIPPLEVQEQIVSILDHFDALVNDLKSGLPAEIALRRKQYEYYRDKLLTFQPLE